AFAVAVTTLSNLRLGGVGVELQVGRGVPDSGRWIRSAGAFRADVDGNRQVVLDGGAIDRPVVLLAVRNARGAGHKHLHHAGIVSEAVDLLRRGLRILG